MELGLLGAEVGWGRSDRGTDAVRLGGVAGHVRETETGGLGRGAPLRGTIRVIDVDEGTIGSFRRAAVLARFGVEAAPGRVVVANLSFRRKCIGPRNGGDRSDRIG